MRIPMNSGALRSDLGQQDHPTFSRKTWPSPIVEREFAKLSERRSRYFSILTSLRWPPDPTSRLLPSVDKAD